MALVNVTNVSVLDNPTKFTNPFQFEITFECLEELADDLEWKLIYVGSAYDPGKDQELESILVGPIPVGLNKIVFQTDAPDVKLIETKDLLGPTVVLLTCSFQEQEFIRVVSPPPAAGANPIRPCLSAALDSPRPRPHLGGAPGCITPRTAALRARSGGGLFVNLSGSFVWPFWCRVTT
eukprot:SAG22_NODE_1348_length_4662_cov_2.722113_2_plen_179_part_00